MPQLKDVAFWEWEYLSGLPPGEHDWIEYKGSPWFDSLDKAKFDDISEYVSAFANYDGGYLVIGMKHGDGSHSPDEGVTLRHPKYGDLKEWLEDKLPGLVDPPIVKLGVKAISNPSDPRKGVIVIHIPESELAPHQGNKERFYSRRGSKMRALTTREIFDIRGRKKHPDLSAEVKIFLRDVRFDKKSRLNLTISNDGEILCRHFGARVRVPCSFERWILNFSDPFFYSTDGSGKSHWVINLGNEQRGPIFPRSKPVFPVDFDSGPGSSTEATTDIIEVRLYADEAPYKDFEFKADEVITIQS